MIGADRAGGALGRPGSAAPRSDSAARLRAIRAHYRGRGTRRSRGDLAYALYCGILVAAAIAFPLGRAVVVGLGDTAAGVTLGDPDATTIVAACLGAVLALTMWIGRLIGPVLISPFFVVLLGATDIPRSRSLRAAMGRTTGLIILALTATGGVAAGAGVRAGVAGPADLLWWCVSLAGYGTIVSVAWLAARALPSRISAAAGSALVIATILSFIFPALLVATPWGWASAAWIEQPGRWPGALMLSSVAGAASAVPWLLNRLELSRVAADAEQTSQVRQAAIAGDLSIGIGGLRAAPFTGRRLHAVRGSSLPLALVGSDLVASLRTPDRTLIGFVSLTLAAGLAGQASALPLGWALGGLAGGLAYAAIGVFCDGLRHAAAARATPALYGVTDRRLSSLHLGLPVVAAILALTIAAPIASAVGGAEPAALTVTAIATLAGAALTRLYDARKGPMPLELMNPVPTPAGDASGMIMALWQIDALVGSVLIGAVSITLLS